jgi:glucose/mannose-6-phosphate isomerase
MVAGRGYELPSWAPAGSAVLCSSYSGNTEETLACYAAAEALGAKRLVATTGGELAELARADGVPVIGLPAGLQPRAAVGYMFCVAAELAALALAGPRIHTEIDAAASQLGRTFEGTEGRARELAAEIGDAIPVVYGSDLTAPVAYRWKTQINENAKSPAFYGTLPEADHNEIEGWAGAEGRFAAIFLGDRDQHPRERKRFELTAKAIEPYAATVIDVETMGESRTERVLHTVMLGDLLAIELANARGVDPLAVDVLEGFKKEMGRP